MQLDKFPGATLDVDIVVKGVPPYGYTGDTTGGLAAFQFLLNYDPAKVIVTAKDTSLMITDGFDFSDDVPDTDGAFTGALATFTATPPGGDGVIMRLTLTKVGAGASSLDLTMGGVDNNLYDAGNRPYHANAAIDGRLTAWATPLGDDDCDAWASRSEGALGTDANDPCGFTLGGPSQSDTWPADLVESNSVNVSDVLAMKPVFGQNVPPVSPRFDLDPSGGINIGDVLTLKPVFGRSCS